MLSSEIPSSIDLLSQNKKLPIIFLNGATTPFSASIIPSSSSIKIICFDKNNPPIEKAIFLIRENLKKIIYPIVQKDIKEICSSNNLPIPSSIRVKFQKTVWGSRSSSGTISINGFIAFFPRELYLHVLIHECCHQVEMNHGAAFYKLMDKIDYNASINNEKLKKANQYIPKWLI